MRPAFMTIGSRSGFSLTVTVASEDASRMLLVHSSARQTLRCLVHPPGAGPGQSALARLPTTDLHTVLRALGRDVLVLMGVATSGAVLYTFCSALDADYELVVVEDGCFEADDEFHSVLMEKVFSRHGAVIQAKDFVKTLSH